jgi:hypothetical protein
MILKLLTSSKKVDKVSFLTSNPKLTAILMLERDFNFKSAQNSMNYQFNLRLKEKSFN